MNNLIGIPYANKGRDPSVGLDCWGLLREFYREYMGIDLPSYTDDYEDSCDSHSMAGAIDRYAPESWKQVTEPMFGDAVLMRINGFCSHVGVYLQNGQMLHTQAGHDSVIDRLDGIRWKNRIKGYFRHESAAKGVA